ncbi:MAG: hypothetical protein LBP76_09450 [Treponema sp.]|jgi:hypothetical protein|nr:hypothetical protein [Treponema sp.]
MASYLRAAADGSLRSDVSGGIRRAYGGKLIPPDWLKNIISVRRFISDPSVNDFILTDEDLPEQGKANAAYVQYGFLYSGNYYGWKNETWAELPLSYSDDYIRETLEGKTVVQAARYLIQLSLLRVEDVYRVISESDGGQSMSFPTLGDLAAFFKEKLLLLADMTRGTEVLARHKEQTVGYVPDSDFWN